MRKLLLFVCVVASIALSSCSDDDNNAAPRRSKVMATINGTAYTFDYVTLNRIQYDGYADIEVVATTEADPDNWIKFVVTEGETGNEASWFFAYYIDNVWYEQQPGLAFTVEENSADKITGTFSGTVEHWDPAVSDLVTITNGSFTAYR